MVMKTGDHAGGAGFKPAFDGDRRLAVLREERPSHEDWLGITVRQGDLVIFSSGEERIRRCL